MPAPNRLAALCATLGLLACRGEPRVGGFAVRDSNGVEIVSNRTAGSREACITVDDQPALVIGGADATGPHELFRVWAMQRLTDGRIAVLNGGTAEVRFFDSAGAHVRTAGRRGSGPGEFGQPVDLTRVGRDSLVVFDVSGDRLTLLDPAGEVAGSVALRNAHGMSPAGALRAGILVFIKYPLRGSGPVSGMRRDTIHVVRFGATGVLHDTLGAFLGPQMVAQEFREGGRRGISFTVLPFGRGTIVAAAGTRTYVGDNGSYRIQVYGDDGRLLRVIESDAPMEPLTARDVEREKARMTRGVTNLEVISSLEAQFRSDLIPSVRPAYDRLQVDEIGWLWVRRFFTAADPAATWDVFDDTGRFRCTVRLRLRFRVTDIGRDYILGVARDEDDVEQVRLYRLRRGS